MEVTANALEEILINKNNINAPVVQVVQIKEEAGTDLIRAALSDGTHFIPAILGSKIKTMIDNQVIQRNSLIRLLKYTTTTNVKKPLIVISAELFKENDSLIGKPVPLALEKLDMPRPLDFPTTSNPATSNNSVLTSPNVPISSPPKQSATYSPQRNQIISPSPPRAPAQNIAGGNVLISSLNSYLSNWSLIVRITTKAPIRQFQGSRPGKLFSIIMRDKNNSEIKGTFFNQEADKFENVVHEGKIYRVSCGKVKKANERFNTTNCEYEITFDSTTSITEIPDDGSIPANTFNAVKIADCSKFLNKTVDIVAIVTGISDVQTLISKKGTPLVKRGVTISDETGSVEVTLWGNTATEFDISVGEVFAARSVTVGDFHGVSLSCGQSSTIVAELPQPDSNNLIAWYSQLDEESKEKIKQTNISTEGLANVNAKNINHLSEIDEKQLCRSDQGDIISFYALIMDIPMSRKLLYKSCPNEACRGSGVIVDEATGTMRCRKCNQEVTNPKLRYSLSVKCGDHTGSMYVNLIGDENVNYPIVNMHPEELDDEDTTKLRDKLLKKSFFRMIRIKARGKMSDFGVKLVALSGSELNFAEEANNLAKNIEELFD